MLLYCLFLLWMVCFSIFRFNCCGNEEQLREAQEVCDSLHKHPGAHCDMGFSPDRLYSMLAMNPQNALATYYFCRVLNWGVALFEGTSIICTACACSEGRSLLN